ncbi:MAG TPA: hypothetical protein VM470_00565 [Acidimicrobiia bacterium]|nr:hypothetical protein [Acidimicrobiia bacterium]
MPSVPANNEPSGPDDLYGLPLDQFTRSRDGLAARLRSEGKPDRAAAVAKLSKPSVAAWALNQAARQNPELVDQLIDSHKLLRGSDTADKLATAAKSRRTAVAVLAEAAAAALAAQGKAASGQTRDRISRTLLAVATEPSGEADLQAGRLVRELEPSGGGWGDIGLPPSAAGQSRSPEIVAAERARQRAERLAAEADSAEQMLAVAAKTLADLKRKAKEARTLADQAADEARAVQLSD